LVPTKLPGLGEILFADRVLTDDPACLLKPVDVRAERRESCGMEKTALSSTGGM
jgi:hypothetical protein